MKSIKFKDRLYKLTKTTPIQHPRFHVYENNLKVYNKILRNLIKEAKLKYYENEFTKNAMDIKKTWKTINSVIKDSNPDGKFPSLIRKHDEVISDEYEIINEMNSYFINIGKNLAPNSTKKYDEFSDTFASISNHTFKFELVTENCVLKIINELKSKDTMDVNGLSTKLLKIVSDILYRPITIIINQSLSSGIFPKQLKIAKVIAIHKGNNLDQNSINSYRPISILPCISKFFERIVYNQLYKYFNSHNLFTTSQYGFRLNHSTELATLEFTNRIYELLNNGYTPITVFMDLSKAFDTLNHTILVNKLMHYGVAEKELEWFISYLGDRFQYVCHNNKFSSLQRISTGVP